jgi:hypothetical protein
MKLHVLKVVKLWQAIGSVYDRRQSKWNMLTEEQYSRTVRSVTRLIKYRLYKLMVVHKHKQPFYFLVLHPVARNITILN